MLRKSPLALLAAAAVAAAGAYEPALRVLKHAHAADGTVEGFSPARCIGEMPPAELLALADWPLDRHGVDCVPHSGVPDAVDATARAEGPRGSSDSAAAAPASEPDSRDEPLLFSGMLVDDGTLDELRGGFETPGGLSLSFGIERLVYINGELASTTTLNIADLAQLAGRGAPEGLPLGAAVAVIQNGPNNSFDAGALASGSFATVIQNSLDNQQIQTVTTINAQANSMDMLRANRLGESLRDAVTSSLLR